VNSQGMLTFIEKTLKEVRMGVVWFGFGFFAVASLVGWVLEKIGILHA